MTSIPQTSLVLDKSVEEPCKNDIAKFELLLEGAKIIRDPVYGDIEITQLECEIIDSPYFQRLRRIRQLGLTYYVYPSANHTRFEHSIGTLFMAQKIIDAVNANYHRRFKEGIQKRDGSISLSEFPIDPQNKFMIRMVALLHDTGHVAFGHTLESEGNIFGQEHQMQDERRMLINKKNIFSIIKKNMIAFSFSSECIEFTLNEIGHVLVAEESGNDEEFENLKMPYIADIVGNTICADLLDYLRRDPYFAGLKMEYDPRIISHFVLHNYQRQGKPEVIRLALILEKRKGIVRSDVLSYCIDLMYKRYSLAEMIYTHRVKTILSAMIIKCIYCAMKGGFLPELRTISKIQEDNEGISDDQLIEELEKDWFKIMTWGDDALIRNIANCETVAKADLIAAKTIAISLINRELYSIVYSKNEYKQEFWEKNKNLYEDPKFRYECENSLEEWFDLDPGSIIIYIQKKDEGKAANVKMYGPTKLSPHVRPLSKLGDENEYKSIGDQIRHINQRYDSLWKFYVLLKKEKADEELNKHIKDLCEDCFSNVDNVIEHFVRAREYILGKKNEEIQGSITINVIHKLEKQIASSPKLFDEIKHSKEWPKTIDNWLITGKLHE